MVQRQSITIEEDETTKHTHLSNHCDRLILME